MERSTSVDIDATPERVWSVLSDVDHWPEWTDTVTSVTRLDDHAELRLGSRVRLEQPKLPPTEYVVSELDAPRGFTWVATGPGVRTTARHGLEALPDGRTRLRLSVEQSGPVGRVMGRLFFTGLTDRYLAAEAAGLKARSEGGR